MHFAIPRPNRVWNIFSPRLKIKNKTYKFFLFLAENLTPTFLL
nr:MAG TPA: hypothetical protein [Caudoviricetes sp.]